MRVHRILLSVLAVACDSDTAPETRSDSDTVGEVAEESCSDATIDPHAKLSFVDPAGAPVEAFAGTAVPSTGGEMTFVCPGDVDCFAGGVVLWTEAPSVALDVATPDGDLAARATVPLAYETQFCGDDGHCAIQCLLAIETVTLSRP